MSMDCTRARDYIEPYADGERVATEVERHIAGCAACARDVEKARELNEKFREAIRAQPVPEWRAARTRVVHRRGFVRHAAAAAAVFLGALWALIALTRPDAVVDPRAAVAAYLADPTEGNARRVVGLGDAGLTAALEALGWPRDAGRAAELLRRFDSGLVEARLARMPETLGSDGPMDLLVDDWPEEERDEVRDALARMLAAESGHEFAVRKLAALDYLALLRSRDRHAQEYAMEIARKVRARLRVPQVIELLSVPELQRQARDVLRQISGTDYGPDAEAWRQWWNRRQGT